MSFKEQPLMTEKEGLVQFYPHIPKKSHQFLKKTLSTRWIGQGPRVDEFEKKFQNKFLNQKIGCVATGSGTDALHLAYILAGLKPGDEVITPVFTCTATNIPFLYMGVKIKFADIDKYTMNICVKSVKKLITKKTKAIVCVHYGGLPCDMNELVKISKKYKIPLISDAAQALGAKYEGKKISEFGDYTTYSFQAIKHITTGDGGMVCFKKKKLIDQAKRIRWFGINREKKQKGIWENDIFEVGYKYQLNDIGASIGILGIKEFSKILKLRRDIFNTYLKKLSKNNNIYCVNDEKNKFHAAWIFTIITSKKDFLQKQLRKKRIETNQIHFRNDKYSIFKKFSVKGSYKNMDAIENDYLVLPLHTKMSVSDAEYVADSINKII